MRIIIAFLGPTIMTAVSLAQPPEIVGVSPAQNELNVHRWTDVAVVFDTDMDRTTLNDTTFRVFGSFTGRCPGEIAYDEGTRTAILDPSDDFAVGEVVTVVLTTDVRSGNGEPLETGFVWSFTAMVEGGATELLYRAEMLTGEDPSSVTVVDCDADGDIDIVCTSWSAGDVEIFLNDGTGSFSIDTTIMTGVEPSMVIAAEVDGRQGVDLVVTNAGTHNIAVLLNDGTGQFAFDDIYPVNWHPTALFGGDFNGDGATDIATVNFYGQDVSVLINDGDGTFDSQYSQYPVGDEPRWISGGDIDNDGDIDLVATVYIGTVFQILLNNGDGTFTVGSSPRAEDPVGLILADLNDDNYLDLAATNYHARDVSVHLNDQQGNYPDRLEFRVTLHPWQIGAADLDGDLDLDLFCGGYDSNSSLLFNNGDGTFGPPVPQISSRSVCAGDLDADGDLDLVTANAYTDKIFILENTGTTLVEGEVDALPDHVGLDRNHPNPFNSVTGIAFYVPRSGTVSLNIYDITGRRVRNLLDCPIDAGKHTVFWDGTNQTGEPSASGIYFYSLGFDRAVLTSRMLLLK